MRKMHIVVEVVLKARILEVIDERCHSKSHNISPNPLNRFDRDKMEWIVVMKLHLPASDLAADENPEPWC